MRQTLGHETVFRTWDSSVQFVRLLVWTAQVQLETCGSQGQSVAGKKFIFYYCCFEINILPSHLFFSVREAVLCFRSIFSLVSCLAHKPRKNSLTEAKCILGIQTARVWLTGHSAFTKAGCCRDFFLFSQHKLSKNFTQSASK
ncbi:hypothetical protein NL108_012548 [Boleophthalmus pectinirostris]|nr:hypothetical protein NL108_012548 [Boleophthalmus pectinirostris]